MPSCVPLPGQRNGLWLLRRVRSGARPGPVHGLLFPGSHGHGLSFPGPMDRMGVHCVPTTLGCAAGLPAGPFRNGPQPERSAPLPQRSAAIRSAPRAAGGLARGSDGPRIRWPEDPMARGSGDPFPGAQSNRRKLPVMNSKPKPIAQAGILCFLQRRCHKVDSRQTGSPSGRWPEDPFPEAELRLWSAGAAAFFVAIAGSAATAFYLHYAVNKSGGTAASPGPAEELVDAGIQGDAR